MFALQNVQTGSYFAGLGWCGVSFDTERAYLYNTVSAAQKDANYYGINSAVEIVKWEEE